MEESLTSICFIAHVAWGEMSGGQKGGFGGIQRQLSMMARWFAARGHTVSLLTYDEGQPDDVIIDGVRVIKMCRSSAGIRGLRFFHPRWTSLISAMRKADAQVYYQNTAECVTGQAADWCARNGRGFVFSVANDYDCEPAAIARMSAQERILYKHGLKKAGAIVCQTKHQQRLLLEGQGVQSVVIPMPSPPTGDGSKPLSPDPASLRVVWVGRIVEAKRLEMYLDLAELAPDITFDVAGAPTRATAYSSALVERGRKLKNVRMLGRVEREQIPQLYRGALCLCCSSIHEGFPNTFLEAWSQGIPIVSTFDPDGLIAGRGLGGVAQSASGLLEQIRKLVTPVAWQAASARSREYYLTHHTPEVVVPQFEELFLSIAREKQRRILSA